MAWSAAKGTTRSAWTGEVTAVFDLMGNRGRSRKRSTDRRPGLPGWPGHQTRANQMTCKARRDWQLDGWSARFGDWLGTARAALDTERTAAWLEK